MNYMGIDHPRQHLYIKEGYEEGLEKYNQL
jgi:hypothetical protein